MELASFLVFNQCLFCSIDLDPLAPCELDLWAPPTLAFCQTNLCLNLRRFRVVDGLDNEIFAIY